LFPLFRFIVAPLWRRFFARVAGPCPGSRAGIEGRGNAKIEATRATVVPVLPRTIQDSKVAYSGSELARVTGAGEARLAISSFSTRDFGSSHPWLVSDNRDRK